MLLYTRDRLAVHSVHRPHGDHAHVYAYLSIYLRAISVYMYVCTVHYFRRSVNRINAIAKHGWLTGLAGWLAGWWTGRPALEQRWSRPAIAGPQFRADDGGTAWRETGHLEPELCYRGVVDLVVSRWKTWVRARDSWADTSAHAAGRL